MDPSAKDLISRFLTVARQIGQVVLVSSHSQMQLPQNTCPQRSLIGLFSLYGRQRPAPRKKWSTPHTRGRMQEELVAAVLPPSAPAIHLTCCQRSWPRDR